MRHFLFTFQLGRKFDIGSYGTELLFALFLWEKNEENKVYLSPRNFSSDSDFCYQKKIQV